MAYCKLSLPSHMSCVLACSTCPIANVPKACQRLIVMCQRADVPIFQLCLPKSVPTFQLLFKTFFQSLSFSIMLNICKFQEYLGHSRKFVSRNKEFKFRHLRNFKEMQN